MKKLQYFNYAILTFIISFVLIMNANAQFDGERVIFVVASLPGNDAELAIQQRLEDMLLEVVLFAEDQVSDATIDGADILLISATVVSGTVFEKMPGLASYTIPVISWETGLYDELGFSTEEGIGIDEPEGKIEIVNSDHSLAAGMSGAVNITTGPTRIGGGKPGGDVSIVATSSSDPSFAALFGYEKGAAMASGNAPARRVGTFLFYDVINAMTDEGWMLFDASVLWAMDDGVTSIGNEENGVPSEFLLSNNYPNPFNPFTTIRYHLQNASKVTMKIYNISGQKIETLVNEYQTAGEHEITWQPKALPGGIYFYKLKAGDFSETKKLILQR